jgi:DNA invertase Pin-like site-specific DNA recombinase
MTKRVGLYLRVSTKNGQTVDNQRQALIRAIGRRQGWSIADEFPDEGISGAKGRDKRPEFDRLLREVVRGKIDVVAAWSVDRLGRSLQDLVGFLGELNAAGCDLYLEKQAVDTTTPAGRALFQMLGVFAEFERAIIQERIHAGIARARDKGTKSGRPIGRARIGPRKKRQSVQRWRAAKASSKLRASAAPVPAWCSGSKLRWHETIAPLREAAYFTSRKS